MTAQSLVSSAWRTGRQERRVNDAARRKVRRQSLLIALFTWLGKRLPTARAVQTVALRLAGLGLINYGVWQINPIAGWICLGVTALVLEMMRDRG